MEFPDGWRANAIKQHSVCLRNGDRCKVFLATVRMNDSEHTAAIPENKREGMLIVEYQRHFNKNGVGWMEKGKSLWLSPQHRETLLKEGQVHIYLLNTEGGSQLPIEITLMS